MIAGWIVLDSYLAFANTAYIDIFVPNAVAALVLLYGVYALVIRKSMQVNIFLSLLVLQLLLYTGLVLLFIYAGQNFRLYLQDQITHLDLKDESSAINWPRVVWFGRSTFETLLAIQLLLIVYVVIFVNAYLGKRMMVVEKTLVALVPLVATIYGIFIVVFVSSDAFGEYVKSFIISQGGTEQSLNMDFITLLGQITWYFILATQVLLVIFVLYHSRKLSFKPKEQGKEKGQKPPKKVWGVFKRLQRLNKNQVADADQKDPE